MRVVKTRKAPWRFGAGFISGAILAFPASLAFGLPFVWMALFLGCLVGLGLVGIFGMGD